MRNDAGVKSLEFGKSRAVFAKSVLIIASSVFGWLDSL